MEGDDLLQYPNAEKYNKEYNFYGNHDGDEDKYDVSMEQVFSKQPMYRILGPNSGPIKVGITDVLVDIVSSEEEEEEELKLIRQKTEEDVFVQQDLDDFYHWIPLDDFDKLLSDIIHNSISEPSPELIDQIHEHKVERHHLGYLDLYVLTSIFKLKVGEAIDFMFLARYVRFYDERLHFNKKLRVNQYFFISSSHFSQCGKLTHKQFTK